MNHLSGMPEACLHLETSGTSRPVGYVQIVELKACRRVLPNVTVHLS